ncbi:hypothetical protein A3F02_04170 [Candidatus Curtissbacteria bacterium RIFCSPHIGHO2_12_FULL_38_9b]|uniref:GHMP kinase N-terminal domain-containing protein n=2 Tax=Candidatus Curtissiibacteriota TaxID=1752717 RepID=A0A1F5GT34_9BACT|nr:MAG: hypothetical protein A3F02_04170 [Candidatus Curtissbacteria bacterium RIFCSPHIGHO2_12_FULL_38_9b]OGD95887.1 MAG: hypothetical protein A3A48_00465 [Candidatus Curtissbacteria bacterium RIFCSPLOWO2_01_FULL_37_9]
MKGRIPANSESLKKTFPKIYGDFFSKCNLVLSAPGSFWWCGEYSNTQGGICFLQKIPQRVYIGITADKNQGIFFADFIYFWPNTNKFILTKLENPQKSKIEAFLNSQFPKTHLKITILSEVRPGSGLNLSGGLACALACSLNLQNNTITSKDIQKWQLAPTSTLIGGQAFEKTFRLAWKIQNLFHADSSSGATAFVPFINTIYPVIYLTEQRSGSFSNNQTTRLPRDLKDHSEIIDTINYSGAKFEEVFSLPEKPSWPIDFCLIYSGDTRTTEDALRAIRYHKERMAQLPLILKKELSKFIIDQSNVYKFQKFLKFKHPKDQLWEKFTDELVVANLVMLALMRLLFEGGMDLETLKLLFWNINNHQRFLSALGVSSPTIDRICLQLLSEVKTIGDLYGAAAKITGAGKKGDILFATNHNGPRDQINYFIKKLKRQINKNIHLDYASWLNGFEEEGVKIEQDLIEKIYSDFISEGSVQIKKINFQGQISTQMISKDQLEKQKADFDLLMDSVNGEIYIKGQEISSKHLPSSKTTIKVIKVLSEKLGKQVKNSAFGKGSYFEDRNEFQSKIISPLVKIVDKKLGKKLNLLLHGGLMDFTVMLKPSPIEIYIIEAIF